MSIPLKTFLGDDNKQGIGFSCKICGGSQEISVYENPIFPVCNKCLSDLKEIILKKRKLPDAI